MRRLNAIFAAALCAALLVPALATAQQVVTARNMYWDFASQKWVAARSNAEGVAYFTDLYPDAFQSGVFPLLGTTVEANKSSSLTAFTPWSTASIYAHKLIRIAVSGAYHPTDSLGIPWRVKFVASNDDATWGWLFDRYPAAFASAPLSDLTHPQLLAANRDTLMIRGRGNTVVGLLVTAGRFQPLTFRDGSPVLEKALAVVFSNDSTGVNTITVTIDAFGRQR